MLLWLRLADMLVLPFGFHLVLLLPPGKKPSARWGSTAEIGQPVPLLAVPTERTIAVWGLVCLVVLLPVGVGVLNAMW